MTREVTWNHLMVKNHLDKPSLRRSQVSFYIAWYLPRLSSHTCNYGISISWCRRPAFISAIGITRGDDAAMVKIQWPLDDVEHINVGPSPMQQYQSQYYRHQGLRPRWAVFVTCVFHDCSKTTGPCSSGHFTGSSYHISHWRVTWILSSQYIRCRHITC